MAPPDSKLDEQGAEAVALYKRLLSDVIDRRPSGTRQRLAAALGKNRSFISQITNPNYLTPIPARHLDTLFEICHFSAEERRRFIEAYTRAHPNRPALVHDAHKTRAHTVYLPDLGDPGKNLALQSAIDVFVRDIAGIIGGGNSKRKRP
ncbi:MAG: hypothetical protein JNM20_02180 [Rhizobiales bacterium]|nr:hypothetical protein [Hyphomicrobiales bacterium]